ncbi:hypothetical protein DQ04_03051040 [Trypanosoma grayi]|uniref:hypothetical protein n=1 Tax=Trypanosoma grayi TaxID=71804 RepID=UPI0004F49255|nr:hypothetical protein DQ04_03051040 [Trypanosoma grayi]KEG11020.1 hypothetical protein DQ04_03051040 [Trypanosoma grayi]
MTNTRRFFFVLEGDALRHETMTLARLDASRVGFNLLPWNHTVAYMKEAAARPLECSSPELLPHGLRSSPPGVYFRRVDGGYESSDPIKPVSKSDLLFFWVWSNVGSALSLSGLDIGACVQPC